MNNQEITTNDRQSVDLTGQFDNQAQPKSSRLKRPFWNSVGTKLFLAVMAGAILGLGATAFLFYRAIEQQAKSQIQNSLSGEVQAIDSQLRQSEQFLLNMANTTQLLHQNKTGSAETYKQMVFSLMAVRPKLVTGFGVLQTPKGLLADRQWFGPYIVEYKAQAVEQVKQGIAERLSAPNEGFAYQETTVTDKYFDQDWYKDAVKVGKNYWTEPYVPDGFSIALTTFAGPIKDSQGKLVAVFNGDISLADLVAAFKDKKVFDRAGYYVLVTPEGKLLAYPPDPQKAIALQEAIAIPELKAVWSQVQPNLSQNRPGIISSGDTSSYWAYQKIPSTNWTILAKVPHSSVSGPAYAIAAGGIGIAAIGLAGTVLLFSRRLNRRLQPILDECYKLAGTNTTQDLLQQQDEINQVSTAFFNLLETQERNTKQLETQNQILTGLARNEALIQGDAKSAAQSITEAATVVLGIERASIWLYNSNKSAIECFDLYQRTPSEHSAGTELTAADFPGYFKALKEEPLIVAADAHAHPATREFSSSYLIPLGIASMLDVPIQIGGQTVGVLCCEHVAQTPKEWTLQEQSFASSLANLMSLALENQITQTEVGHLLDIVSSVEEGDLQVRAKVSDRPTGLVSDTFNRLIEELVAVLGQVLNTAQQVSQGANNLEQIATTVAANAEQQAQSVDRVLNLSEQVKQSTQDTDVQVQETNQSLGALSAAVGEGKTAISSLSQGIGVLQQGTDRIIQQMKTLGEFVGLADQFVQEQSQIASMTQILSMNAALVAARAAEQRNPKQFANVAREFESIAGQVSKLAQQTNDGLSLLEQRTGQIHNVVSGIDREVQSLGGLVSSFNQGVEQSERVFQNVQAVAAESLDAGRAIASSSQEIANISQSTSTALQDVAQLAQKTAQLTQNTRSQSTAIGALSAQLLQRIKFFQLPASALPEPEVEVPIDSELAEDVLVGGNVPVTAQK